MPSVISPVVGKIYTRRECLLIWRKYELRGGYSFIATVFLFLSSLICFHHGITLMGVHLAVPLAVLTVIALITMFWFFWLSSRWMFAPRRTIWELYDLSGRYIDIYSALRQIHYFRQRLTRREWKMFLDALSERIDADDNDDDDDDDDGYRHRLNKAKKAVPFFGLVPGIA